MRTSVILCLLFATVVLGNTCGGNCPSNDCSSCPCGTTRSVVNIADECAKYSDWNQKCCQCIVDHESGGDANAVNENTNGSFDVGVWQINSINWPSCNAGKAPCGVAENLNCASKIWNSGGRSFKAWSTCGGCGCC